MPRFDHRILAPYCLVLLGLGCGDDSSGDDAMNSRGAGVPSTWADYCAELGEVWCQREQGCEAGAVDDCMNVFRVGCCEIENICSSSFGEGVTTAEYDTCIDDTNNGACGSDAPPSCRALVGDTPPMSSEEPRTLEGACAASCFAQEATNCPGVFPASVCIDACTSLPMTLPECRDAWIALNSCMADAPLFCDTVNGGAAVSSDDCGPEIEAFVDC